MSDFDFDGEKQEAASHRDISDKLDLAKIGADEKHINKATSTPTHILFWLRCAPVLKNIFLPLFPFQLWSLKSAVIGSSENRDI